MDAVRYFIGLGGNLGDRAARLREAAEGLRALGEIRGRSRIYSTEPVGGPPQPPYLNAALELVSPLPPTDLLARTQDLERQLGRDRSSEVRWGPRCIDIDLLLAGDHGELMLTLPGLSLPHPRLHERAFALAGLVDLDRDLVHPTVARPLVALLGERRRTEAVAPVGETL